MAEKIQLLHPLGKKAVQIDLDKYNIISRAILNSLANGNELTHKELFEFVKQFFLSEKIDFSGSIEWYMESVKLDLEAKNTIQRFKEKQMLKFRLLNSK